MATRSTTQLNRLAAGWEDSYPSAVTSGIVGDLAHKQRGGYHISREDQPSTNYSVTRPDDRLGPSDAAAAVDMNLGLADMVLCHTRLRAAWLAGDPRMIYINAWNGWDGEGDAGRYDVVEHEVSTATADHKWHCHLEVRRRYVNSSVAIDAILSLLRGETLEDDMATISQADFNARMDAWWNDRMKADETPSPALAKLRVAPWQQPVGRTGRSTHDTLFGDMQAQLNEMEAEVAKLGVVLADIKAALVGTAVPPATPATTTKTK